MRTNRVYAGMVTVLIAVMAVCLSRVFFLTVFMGRHFAGLARGNMVRSEVIEPRRGVISDRNGRALALNIEYQGRTVRHYPGGEVLGGVIGYVGKPTVEDLKLCRECSRESMVGKSGLERYYQNELFGLKGSLLTQESADGKPRLEIKRQEAVPGVNLTTNLDFELQKVVFLALKNKLKETGVSASGVVARVGGEVLALASVPSFDPNLFIADGKRSDFGGDYKDVESVINDKKGLPLFNRVIAGDFAPGSVFKLVPALGALEEGKINRSTEIQDTGEIKVGEYRFGNWLLDKYGATEGSLNVAKALSRSNDIFFYKIGEALGADSLIEWTKRFGLGERSGVDLPGESSGFVPTPYWREKNLGEKWFLGNTYHFAIGQGDLMATPIQINRMTAGVVSGLRCDPHIVGTSTCTSENLNPKNVESVLEGMKQTCSPGGTAFPLFEYAGRVYCKTGTAQKGGKETLPNAWISVVVPKGQSVKDWVVITILVEEGGEGSVVAGPIAKEVVAYLLGTKW